MQSVVVIGAGPAGSLAAMLLARAGFHVELIEQQRFPRDKVCGECWSALGISVLQRAGLFASIEPLSPVRLTRTLIHPIEGPSIDIALPQTMWGLSRVALDTVLLAEAKRSGVIVHQPGRCEVIIPGSKPTVCYRELTTNSRIEQRFDRVIVADGKGTLLKRTPAATGDLGIKTHFECVDGPRDAIELFAGHGHYGGLAAVEGDRWNAAFSVPASRVKQFGGKVHRLFADVVEQTPALQNRLHSARQCSDWLASPLPRFAVSRVWPAGVVPVGNAAAALEPVGGEGMGLALRSAELAAEAIIKSDSDGSTSAVDNLPGQFNRLWQVRRAVCRGIANAVSNYAVSEPLAPLMAYNPGLTAAVMRWAGKI